QARQASHYRGQDHHVRADESARSPCHPPGAREARGSRDQERGGRRRPERADYSRASLTGRGEKNLMITLGNVGPIVVLLSASGALACAPTPVRGDEVAGLDQEAMGTGLDRVDLQKMLHDNMSALQSSAVIQRWQGENRPTLAVLPIRNDTS